MSKLATIRQMIASAERILVVTHIGPDGDALGSLTAVGTALSQFGKNYSLVCDDGGLSRFRYLPLADQIQKQRDGNTKYDLLIAVDCGDEMRMGQAYATLPDPKPPIINIDHHITNTMFGDVNLVNPDATSAAEVLFGLFAEMGLALTDDLALSLLTGLVTDTLGFRTVGVTPTTMKIASKLMDAGADLSLVTMHGLNLKPLSTVRMWQIGLNNMRNENGLIWTTIGKEELAVLGLNGASNAGLVNLLADIDEAAIGAVLMETNEGTVRVGFRCRPPYNVAELAMNLGGGGHPLAAGCTLDGPLDKAESLVVDMCKDAIRQQSRTVEYG
ncbi:MAG: bifunctional oligoribonuclease/PAP phosphatase NrnA [Ardenticatenaceae bacterium]|nr:bifunctional oligoribonuclease/PAP phosphatase NrnA [Anaerolineales bacterium]MCB8922647.1 bifunctional oligoribonuclease/PAP phosphatase NrnA [Ardenticatenaceae bacterium]MCB9003645.1 bifunctional oligoribonuclease/PAP phosphatase NrnA [Ardenticatenaceae bacterium]